jgi:hypothetical protein
MMYTSYHMNKCAKRPAEEIGLRVAARSSATVPVQLWNGVIPIAMALGLTIGVLDVGTLTLRPKRQPRQVVRRFQRTLPITKFYDTPDPLPAGKPGILIRSQEFDGYELLYSVSVVRILYHSRSAREEDVAVSGVVLFPYDKKPPARGWPVIAWAHGSAGVGRVCAPSLMRNIGHGPSSQCM